MGLLSLANAQNAAYDRGLDLVLIAPQAEPPVCKIIDYGRFRFERDKKDKEAKKKQQVIDIKEIQLSCHIDTNDFNTKANHARRFLTSGDKVKVIVRFRGRQMSHIELGRDLLTRFTEACADIGSVDKAPILEGRSLTMFLAPIKQSASDKSSSLEKAGTR
ncbi:MAG: translation initiation factor IF-3 [Eubacteriales bacterium]|jgi:translation initiation factor IF-3|nr:translation initiation factor IF-3 [Eubacteriales bacterium]